MSAQSRRTPGAFVGKHVALVQRRGRFVTAEPLFERGPSVALDRRDRSHEGRMALVEFKPRKGRVLSDLGSPERARDVVEALLHERLGGRGFRPQLEAEAGSAIAAVGSRSGRRRDLTSLPTFTVDPATARDFDDAVSAEQTGDGVRLWIHIADVAAYVRPGSPLDREGLARANSTYVPGSVEPMLPLALSADACSLTPGVERLAVTAEIELGGEGDARSARFYRSRVRSDVRLDYDQLDKMFGGREAPPAEVAEPLAIARRAAASLGGQRAELALDVESFEPEFAFDDEGNVLGASAVPQTESHRLIERLMVLTNEQVAQLLERARVPTLFRVHEQPDPQRIESLIAQLASLDVPTPPLPERLAPREAAVIAAEASRLAVAEGARRGHGQRSYTSLVLRALKQARYDDRNLGHAGLASDAYCHFTSPIRRYPDLIAHRGLLSAVGEGETAPARGAVREAGVHCSERERDSTRVERQADDVCAAFLLERELLQGGWEREFEGEVVGLVGAGAFVAFGGDLGDVYEGFVAARRLRGEWFELNETETALVGAKSGRELRFGDPLTVRVERVDALRGRVDLEPVEG